MGAVRFSAHLQRCCEVAGVQMGIDIRGRPDVRVAGEHLGELQVAASAQECGDGRMPRLVTRGPQKSSVLLTDASAGVIRSSVDLPQW